jgi:farnesyl-diphosphate farnesyltransferase
VADTLEDATDLAADEKLAALRDFEGLLTRPSASGTRALAERWAIRRPTTHAGYAELLRELPSVMATASRLPPGAWSLIAEHTARTTRRMSAFVARDGEHGMALRDLDDLQSYCYAVAGIVGELLTELFLVAEPALAPVASSLRADAAAFGEALQLVNILKDAADDSEEGRHFLPASVQREAVIALARRDLETAARYCATLDRAAAGSGIIGFATLPVLLGRATLAVVERDGPGAKVGRAELARIIEELGIALGEGRVGSLLDAAEGTGNMVAPAP